MMGILDAYAKGQQQKLILVRVRTTVFCFTFSGINSYYNFGRFLHRNIIVAKVLLCFQMRFCIQILINSTYTFVLYHFLFYIAIKTKNRHKKILEGFDTQ